MFQFQGSLDCDWKQRRKESSTMAAAASWTKELMSKRSLLLHQHSSLGLALLFDAPHLLPVALKVTCVAVGAYKTVLDG